jgi:hypothetical protein
MYQIVINVYIIYQLYEEGALSRGLARNPGCLYMVRK